MSTPYTAGKYAAGLRAAASLGLMAAGFGIANFPMPGPLVGVGLSLLGFWFSARNLALLIRYMAAEQILLNEPHSRLDSAFRRASMPRKIFHLLFSVAEIDGSAGPKERELVRRFLLERFQRPDVFEDIRHWQATAVPLDQIDELVHELRAMLTLPECETVFSWCCLVALIDQKFKAIEHDVLQKIARHFGLPGHHARSIFLQAKLTVMGGQQSWRKTEAPSSQPRDQALRILGLEPNATPDQIKKRHRELVKKYHPDAHSHLGPVAAEEATARFRQVQAAYESLTG